VEISWNLAEFFLYDPTDVTNIQTFPMVGTITLPEGVTNGGNHPLTVSVQVTVGVDPRISIAEANEAMTGAVVTVEGYVTARRIGDNHRIVIQDSSEPWGGIFVQDTVPAAASIAYQYVGQWVRVTGTRGVQWHNNAIHATSIEPLTADIRRPMEPVVITMADFDLGVPGRWNNMMISITAPLIQRDAPLGGPNIHMIRVPGEGLIDISGTMPAEIQDGDMIHVDRMIMHWRNDLESHRLHADWVGGSITSR
jgi:hypothetical protein